MIYPRISTHVIDNLIHTGTVPNFHSTSIGSFMLKGHHK